MNYEHFYTRANEPLHNIQFETSPRHLAGRGDPRHVTQALRAAGWKNHSAPDFPHVILASPDYRHDLVLEPETGSYGAWWRLNLRADSSWWAHFGGNTPVEIIAGATDTLVHPVPAGTPPIWPALAAAGWTYEQDARGREQALHLDGILSLRTLLHDDGTLMYTQVETRLSNGLGGHQRLWDASFSSHTPPYVIAGFVTSLLSPEPVQRAMADVPHPHLVTQEQRGSQGEQLVAARQARLEHMRVTARKVRRASALETKPGPKATPVVPSAARRL